jgi:hypothetical protein
MKLIAVGLLFSKPLGVISRGPAPGDNQIAHVVELAANGGANSAHPARYVSDFPAHEPISLL